MGWSKDMPPKTGFYWLKAGELAPAVVLVDFQNSPFKGIPVILETGSELRNYSGGGDWFLEKHMNISALWYGPLEIPLDDV